MGCHLPDFIYLNLYNQRTCGFFRISLVLEQYWKSTEGTLMLQENQHQFTSKPLL